MHSTGLEHIPRERFLSSESLRAEFERLWPRVWQIAGPMSQLSEPGAQFTYELGLESIRLVRQENGSIAASHGGLSIPCEVWAGFVWVCRDSLAAPLMEFLGPIRTQIDTYGLDTFVLVDDRTKEVRTNWKVAASEFTEWSLVEQRHPDLVSSIGAGEARAELFGLHGRFVVPFYARVGSDGRVRGPGWMPNEVGVDPSTLTGSPADVRRTLQKAIRSKALSMDLDIAPLSDEQLTDVHFYSVFPNVNLQVQWSKFTLRRYRPHPTDPGITLMDVQQYKRPKRGQVHPGPAHIDLGAGEGSLGYPDDEDVAATEKAWSGGFDGQDLGDQELILRNMHRGLDVYLRPS